MTNRPARYAHRARGGKRAAAALLLALCTMVGLMLGAAPAQAAPPAGKPTKSQLTVPLYKASSGKPGTNAAAPVYCGDAIFNIDRPIGSENSTIEYGFANIQGFGVITFNIAVAYQNVSINVNDTFFDNDVFAIPDFGQTYSQSVFTGATGTVTAQAGARIFVLGIGACFAYPVDVSPM